jgi:hypothetical protein
MELNERSEEVELKPLSQCVFAFCLGNRGCAFLAPVRDFQCDTFPETLSVQRPNELATERRSAFRVPIFGDSAPVVQIRGNDQASWTPQPVDISLTGILVDFSKGEVPDLPIDTSVQVQLRLNEVEVELLGQVRRRDGARYGIFFSEVLKGGEVEPPSALSELVRELEEIWLQRKE